jgi:predicted MFS family arabinose efflux permease
LKIVPFRRYFIARSVSAVGSSMSYLAVTFAILRIGGSVAQLGLVLAAGTIPALLFTLFGGVAGDRWERRRILLGCDLTLMAVQTTLATLLLTGHAAVWQFVLAQLIDGSALAFAEPAGVGLLPTLVSGDHLQEGNSLVRISQNIAGLVGPPAAAAIVAVGSPGWALAADALSFAVSAGFVACLPKSTGPVRAAASVWHDIRTGWREFASRRWLWLMVLSFAVYQATVLPAIFVLGPVLSQRHLDGPASWATVLFARAIGAVLIGLVLLRWRPRRPLVASALIILLDLPFLAALIGGLPLAAVAAFAALSSAGVVAADTVWESTLQREVPSSLLSRVSSYESLGSIAINPLGFALIGAMAGAFGVTPVLLSVLIIEVAVHALLLASPSIRAVRWLHSDPQESAGATAATTTSQPTEGGSIPNKESVP